MNFPIPEQQRAKLAAIRQAIADHSLTEREYSVAERQAAAKTGDALPDGSFPIYTQADLKHAIHLWGHSTDPAAAKAHIVRRAHDLGLESDLPFDWHPKGHAIAEATPTTAGSESPPPAGVTLAEHVELIEAVVAPQSGAENGRHIVEVTLLRSGTSRNGNHYPPDVLERAVPLFEGAVAFADHSSNPNLPERSVRDIVGHYSQVHPIREGNETKLRANLHLLPGTDWLFSLLSEAAGSNSRLCGLSIDALGKVNESRSTPNARFIEELKSINSVDIVTRPSAGGGVTRILQSDWPGDAVTGTAVMDSPPTAHADFPHDHPQPHPHHSEVHHMDPQTSPVAQNPTQAPPQQVTAPVHESQHNQTAPQAPQQQSPQSPDVVSLIEQLTREREAYKSQLERVTQTLAPSSPKPVDPNADVARIVEEFRREQQLDRCAAQLSEALNTSGLPKPVTEKISKSFGGRIFESAILDAAIAEERAVLAELSTSGEIRGMGYEKSLSVGMSEYEQLQAGFDKMFDIEESEAAKSVPAFRGLREAFFTATGRDIGSLGGADAPLRESFAHGLRNYVRANLSNLRESEVLLREADVTTASFSYLLGTSMNKRLLKDYQAWPSEWQKFTTITAIKDFKQQDRVRLGAFGSLSTVSEDAAYTTLTVTDTRAIYTPTKRGNLVQVTRETIINDDLYAIKQIPQKLAAAAAFTLAEFVYNLLAPNFGNIYDSHPLFDSVNHLNTGVTAGNLNTAGSGTALSSAALQTAIIKMRKQTNMAGKPIGLKPRYLLVCPDLEFTAMTILRSAGLPGGNNNDINPMMGYAEPIVSPQLNALSAGPTSTTIAIAVADPRVIDTLEVGFVGGQANPVLLIQDMPLYGLNFTQDTISYKVRHEYGGAVVDYRGFYLVNN